jgi:hypothetical protein
MKKILLIILVIIVNKNLKSQHLIITNQNDTIHAKIIELNKLFYSYNDLDFDNDKNYISRKFVKNIVPNGLDTLFKITDSFNTGPTSADYLYRSGFRMMTSRIISISSVIASVFAYNGGQNYVFSSIFIGSGVIISTILDFSAYNNLLKAGEKLKLEQYEQLKKEKMNSTPR